MLSVQSPDLKGLKLTWVKPFCEWWTRSFLEHNCDLFHGDVSQSLATADGHGDIYRRIQGHGGLFVNAEDLPGLDKGETMTCSLRGSSGVDTASLKPKPQTSGARWLRPDTAETTFKVKVLWLWGVKCWICLKDQLIASIHHRDIAGLWLVQITSAGIYLNELEMLIAVTRVTKGCPCSWH